MVTALVRSSDPGGDAAGKEFWESSWKGLKPELYKGPVFQFAHLAKRFLPADRSKKLIELGAMPGNHLVYFQKEFGYHVTGLDYVSEINLLRETFEINQMQEYEIINADLFSVNYTNEYDIVFSSGLVEHFDDATAIMDKHYEILRPGGLLFIGLPNTRYVHWFLMRLFCKDILNVHRTHLMSLQVLQNYARKKRMEVLFCDYVTTFRVFYPVPAWFTWCCRAFGKVLVVLRMREISNKFGSPFIFLIAKKRETL